MKLSSGGDKRKGSRYANTFNRANRFVWTRLMRQQLTVRCVEHTVQKTQRVLLTITGSSDSQSITIDLTALTGHELEAFKETVLIATEVAEPIVATLDKAALENVNADDSDDRIYRPLPTVVVRKGALKEYDEGVLRRRSAFFQRDGMRILAGVGPGDEGGDLDQRQSSGLATEDHASEDDQPT